jgi:uncharacterized protein (TIRG00374 family)
MMEWIRDKRAWGRWLPWLLVAALLAWIFRTVSLEAVWRVLAQVEMDRLLALILLNGLILAALNGRWWIILRAQGHRVPFFPLLGHRLTAYGISYFTPGPQFGGEPAQVYLLEQSHTVPRPTAIASVTMDKLMELLVNVLVLGAGVVFLLQTEVFPVMVGGKTAVFLLIIVAIPALFLLATGLGWYPVSRVLRAGERPLAPLWRRRPAWQTRYERAAEALAAAEIQATHFCRSSPLALLLTFLLSVAAWGLMIAEFWLMLDALGLTLAPSQVIALIVAARLAILLPMPGGLGTLEAGQVLALRLLGFDAAAGIGTSLLIRARDVSLGLLGLWLGGRRWRRLRPAPLRDE